MTTTLRQNVNICKNLTVENTYQSQRFVNTGICTLNDTTLQTSTFVASTISSGTNITIDDGVFTNLSINQTTIFSSGLDNIPIGNLFPSLGYFTQVEANTLDNTPISGAEGTFTTLSASSSATFDIGQITPSTGTFTTVQTNELLFPNELNGINIGATTPSTGIFTTLEASTLDNTPISGAAGTFTTLNASSSATFAIGQTTPSTGTFTTVTTTDYTFAAGINGIDIGSTTPAAGTFTTLEATTLDDTSIGQENPQNGTFAALTVTDDLQLLSGLNNTSIGNVTPTVGSFDDVITTNLNATALGKDLDCNDYDMQNVKIETQFINGTQFGTNNTATFTTFTNDSLTVNNTNNIDNTPPFTLSNTSIGDASIRFTIAPESYVIGIDNTTSYFNITRGSFLSLTNALQIDNTPSHVVTISNPNFTGGTIDNVSITTTSTSRIDTLMVTNLNASNLGNALNANDQTLTNVNIDGENINNTTISTTLSAECTDVDTATGNISQISATTLTNLVNMDMNDQSVTNAVITGGNIDNTSITTTLSTTFTNLSCQYAYITPLCILEQQGAGDNVLQFKDTLEEYSMGVTSALFKISASNLLNTNTAMTISNVDDSVTFPNVILQGGTINNTPIDTTQNVSFSTLTCTSLASTGGTITLQSSLNANSQPIDNVVLLSGTIDGTTINTTFHSYFLDITTDTLSPTAIGATTLTGSLNVATDVTVNNVVIESGSIDNVDFNTTFACSFTDLISSNSNYTFLQIEQQSTGDACLGFTLTSSAQSYTLGIDNSDNDDFKICTGTTMGLNTVLTCSALTSEVIFNTTSVNLTGGNINNIPLTLSTIDVDDFYCTTLTPLAPGLTLISALDGNSQAITNVDINSGTIDGNGTTTIGTDVASTIQATTFTTTTLNVTTLNGTVDVDNWSITNIATDSGTINNVPIVSPDASFTTLTSTSGTTCTTLNVDTLTEATNFASKALTNVNIDSGTIDNIALNLTSASMNSVFINSTDVTLTYGTYDPVIKLWTNFFNSTGTVNKGYYLKMGRMVWLQIRGAWVFVASPNVRWTISLPFPISASWPRACGCISNSSKSRANSQYDTMECFGTPGDTPWLQGDVIEIRTKNWNTGVSSFYQASNLYDNGTINIYLFYMTD